MNISLFLAYERRGKEENEEERDHSITFITGDSKKGGGKGKRICFHHRSGGREGKEKNQNIGSLPRTVEKKGAVKTGGGKEKGAGCARTPSVRKKGGRECFLKPKGGGGKKGAFDRGKGEMGRGG